MRRLFTTEDALRLGLTPATLRWGERDARWRRIDRRLWADGPEDFTDLDRARAAVMATGGVASHHLAGVLYGLDSVRLDGTWMTLPRDGNGRRPRATRRPLPNQVVVTVAGLDCTDGLRTVIDLACSLSDLVWEQALESALRKGLISVEALQTLTGQSRAAVRVRRVLDLRPAGALQPRRSSATR